MEQYIPKSTLVTEIKRREKIVGKRLRINNSYTEEGNAAWERDKALYVAYNSLLSFLDTLEVKDPYEQCIQYDSIKAGIQAHAETYSFNIESHLFPQLTKEQQALWRKEIEQACISGGDMGYSLAKDPRYKENLEVKEVDSNDAFIEKACEYLNKSCRRFILTEKDIDDFRKYMKGE